MLIVEVCTSLTEDCSGVVQRGILRILEAFLAFLTALEEAQKEVAPSNDAEKPLELPIFIADLLTPERCTYRKPVKM